MKFRDLAINQMFHFDGLIESGLTTHEGKPGSYLYVKRSTRTYDCIGYGAVLFEHADAEEKLGAKFVEQAKVNRSGRVGSINAKVYPG